MLDFQTVNIKFPYALKDISFSNENVLTKEVTTFIFNNVRDVSCVVTSDEFLSLTKEEQQFVLSHAYSSTSQDRTSEGKTLGEILSTCKKTYYFVFDYSVSLKETFDDFKDFLRRENSTIVQVELLPDYKISLFYEGSSLGLESALTLKFTEVIKNNIDFTI